MEFISWCLLVILYALFMTIVAHRAERRADYYSYRFYDAQAELLARGIEVDKTDKYEDD